MNAQERATLLTLVNHARDAYKISNETADELRQALAAPALPLAAPVSESDMLTYAEAAGFLPNTIHAWMPALTRYTKSVISADRAAGAEPCKRCRGRGAIDHGDPEIGEALFDCPDCVIAPRPPAQPAPLMRPEDAIKLQAAELIESAVALGIVVTIERRALKPLAMGHAEYHIETRPARVAS